MTAPPDTARLIQDVLAKLGWSADASAIAADVRRLDKGLPCEDEFSVVCAWLGRCQLLHKLDQQQIPIASRTQFQVPDLLAKFTTQRTQSPVLVEVKSKNEKTLSFKPDYLQRLTNYAALLGLPLLIAWKFWGLWTLFEVRHLRQADKNFNISLEMAMRENLLGVLAGDVAYKIGTGAGIHLRFRKDSLVKRDNDANGHTEHWLTTIDDVAFTDYERTFRRDLDAEVQSLFTACELEQTEEHSDTHLHLRLLASTDEMQFAHMALVRLLNWESGNDERPHWRRLLQKARVTANIENFSAALEAAFRQKVVSHVVHLRPRSMPEFLAP
jgi:Holliday junction resolvase